MEGSDLLLKAVEIAATGMATETGRQIAQRFFAALSARFKGKSDAEMTLGKYREKPKVWAEPLRDALEETGAARDDELLALAQQLLEMAGDRTIQVATGTAVAQTAGDVGTLIQSGGGPVNVTVPGARDVPDLGMDSRTFEKNVKPTLIAQGYEVAISSVDNLLGHLVEGWEEVIMPVGGRTGRVVITFMGNLDSVPIKRKPPWADLSEEARKLLAHTFKSEMKALYTSEGRQFYVKAGARDFQGNEWRLALQELEDADLIRYHKGAMHVITPTGHKVAEAMLAALGEGWLV